MIFSHGFLQKAGQVTSLEKKTVLIAFPYSFHEAGRKRKHVSTACLGLYLLTLRDSVPKIALYWIQNRKVRKGVKEIKYENGNPL